MDSEILKHKEAHFSGSFEQMIEYYKLQKIGTLSDINIRRIEHLQHQEQQNHGSLSNEYLSEDDIAEVLEAKKMYKELKEHYQNPQKNELLTLIYDLILTEKEYPLDEINAVVKQQNAITKNLIHILQNPNLSNPLFPGYGLAPLNIIRCLKHLKDEKAIPILFETFKRCDYYIENEVIQALIEMKSVSTQFLIQRIKSLPISHDNEHAACILSNFPPKQDISMSAFEVLKTIQIQKNTPLVGYLLLCCGKLKGNKNRETLNKLMKNTKLFHQELLIINDSWNNLN